MKLKEGEVFIVKTMWGLKLYNSYGQLKSNCKVSDEIYKVDLKNITYG